MSTKKIPWFQLFKYAVYLLLTSNVFLFLRKEGLAASHRFTDGISLDELIAAFPSTIDTGAWVVLILLFELETYVLSDEKLQGHLKWVLRIIRSISYAFIVYSFTAYWTNYQWVLRFSSIEMTALCDFVGHSWMKQVDEFAKITTETCTTLSTSDSFLKFPERNILIDAEGWTKACRLAMLDVINSGAWILVVIVLEIDVWLQLQSKLTGKIYTISKFIKTILYLTLLSAAVYWGISGEFLDFWDAFLWIVAFFFIEMNLFEWQAQTNSNESLKQ